MGTMVVVSVADDDEVIISSPSEYKTDLGQEIVATMEVVGMEITDSLMVGLRKYDVPALIRVLWQYTPDKERLLALLEKEI